MSSVQSPIITPVLVAGSTASPYTYLVNITQRLCSTACSENPPVFAPQFTLESVSRLGNNVYVANIRVQGLISYVPCGGNVCCAKTQPLSGVFSLPFTSETYPSSVTIESVGQTVNALNTAACQTCSRTFISETPISIAVVGAAVTGN